MGTSVNNKCKAFTSLEQSKKLAEILPIESADMWWSWFSDPFDYINGGEYATEPLLHKPVCNPKKIIPCWSLTALLDILPEETRLLKSATDDTYHCDCPKGNIEKWFDNPVDACYEMILKLHEQKLI